MLSKGEMFSRGLIKFENQPMENLRRDLDGLRRRWRWWNLGRVWSSQKKKGLKLKGMKSVSEYLLKLIKWDISNLASNYFLIFRKKICFGFFSFPWPHFIILKISIISWIERSFPLFYKETLDKKGAVQSILNIIIGI